jgi:hypothetical protein
MVDRFLKPAKGGRHANAKLRDGLEQLAFLRFPSLRTPFKNDQSRLS